MSKWDVEKFYLVHQVCHFLFDNCFWLFEFGYVYLVIVYTIGSPVLVNNINL